MQILEEYFDEVLRSSLQTEDCCIKYLVQTRPGTENGVVRILDGVKLSRCKPEITDLVERICLQYQETADSFGSLKTDRTPAQDQQWSPLDPLLFCSHSYQQPRVV